MNNCSILKGKNEVHIERERRMLPFHASIFDFDQNNHIARGLHLHHLIHVQISVHMYLHGVIDPFLLKKNIDWLRHHFDKKILLIVTNLFRLCLTYLNINSMQDFEAKKKIVSFNNFIHFWLIYFSETMNIFIKNELFRKDILQIPFE